MLVSFSIMKSFEKDFFFQDAFRIVLSTNFLVSTIKIKRHTCTRENNLMIFGFY